MNRWSLIAVALIVATACAFILEPRGGDNPATPLAPPPTTFFMLSSPRNARIVQNLTLRNVGGESVEVTVNLAVPRDWHPGIYVDVEEVAAPKGDIIQYASRDNSYVRNRFTLTPGEEATIGVKFRLLTYKTEYFVRREVAAFSHSPELELYTEPELFIEADAPQIQALASSLVGSMLDPIQIAQRVYDHVTSSMTYEVQTEDHGALWAHENRKGDCTEFSNLFTALMRATGIPTRPVIGYLRTDALESGVSMHQWAEFYVEELGWIPVDPTAGKQRPSAHFGETSNGYIPIIKGPDSSSPSNALWAVASERMERISISHSLEYEPLQVPSAGLKEKFETNRLLLNIYQASSAAYQSSFNVSSINDSLLEIYQTALSQIPTSKIEDMRKILTSTSELIIEDAESSLKRAYEQNRILGAIGGRRYLDLAKGSDPSDYAAVIQNALKAKESAEKSPTFYTLLLPFVSLSSLIIILEKERI